MPRCSLWQFAPGIHLFRYLRCVLSECIILVELHRCFQPFLLLALDDYFSDPSQECLARLFDAINSMDLSCAPILTRPEKMVMRSSDRKDIFSERFVNIPSQQVLGPPSSNVGKKPLHQHKSTHSSESHSSFEEGFLMKSKDRHPDDIKNRRKDPEDSSFSLGGSAVWVGDESGLDITSKEKSTDAGSGTLVGSSRPRRSTDASSSSSQAHSKEHSSRHIPPRHPYSDSHYRHGIVKDTHFYHTTAAYKDHHLPVKMPLSTFPEEVGDVGYHSH